MNKYLIKIASAIPVMPATPAKTALHQTIAAVPSDALGIWAGSKLALRSGMGEGKGAFMGATLGGLATNYAVLKHQELKRKRNI